MNNIEAHADAIQQNRIVQEKTNAANAKRIKEGAAGKAPVEDPGPHSRAAERGDPNAI
jgi:hypothetical protein